MRLGTGGLAAIDSTRRRWLVVLLAFLLAAAGLLVTAAEAGADVTPSMVDETLAAGESHTVTKTVDVPAVPPKLDLCLIVDLSGSYNDDLVNIQDLADDIVAGVRAEVADSQFALGTFVDYPFPPWGSVASGDYAYARNLSMTDNDAAWISAIGGLTTFFGGDGPESQYEALFQAATGTGRDVPPAGSSTGDIATGLDCGFRADASKVIAITTDASFHTPGDSSCTGPAPCPFPYPGPSHTDTVNALNAAGISVIAIKAPGAGSEMDDVADETDGAVVTTDSESTEIVDAILTGLELISRDITAEPVGCDPLEFDFDPSAHEDVVGGEEVTVEFEETITVPKGTDRQDIHCTVDFLADETVIATQDVWITVDGQFDPCTEGESGCETDPDPDDKGGTGTAACPPGEECGKPDGFVQVIFQAGFCESTDQCESVWLADVKIDGDAFYLIVDVPDKKKSAKAVIVDDQGNVNDAKTCQPPKTVFFCVDKKHPDWDQKEGVFPIRFPAEDPRGGYR